jgi:hypothetical protein
MNVNHLDARAITQPGGMYAGINDMLLQGVAAYLQSKEREANAQRQMRRDEVGMGREQLRDAMMAAERYGVAPAAQDAGWLRPDAQPLIEAARAKYTQSMQDDALTRRMKLLQAAGAGVAPVPGEPDIMGERWPDPEEAAAYERWKRRTALDESRAALGVDVDKVRLKALKDEAFKNSPLVSGLTSTARGVGDWLGKAGLEKIKADGRSNTDPVLRDLRGELAKAMSVDTHYPWGLKDQTPMTGASLNAYRANLRKQIASANGVPEAAPSVSGQATAINGSTAPNSDFMPEDGYDDQTIAALTHAKFTPSLVKEWTDAAESAGKANATPQEKMMFTEGLKKLNPIERNALMMALTNKAR